MCKTMLFKRKKLYKYINYWLFIMSYACDKPICVLAIFHEVIRIIRY